MPTIIFIDPDGTRHEASGNDGMSAMEIARGTGIEGIEADCGGACACATCHVYVDRQWVERVGPASGDEAEMLEFAVDPRPHSRLSCQIRMSAALDGLTLELPYSQH